MRMHRWVSLGCFLGLVFLIEWAGQQMTFTSVRDWYVRLNKPSWTPPSWLFGPVWTILYGMIAVSGWLIWLKVKPSRDRKLSFYVYGAQLIANLSWSFFFFFLKSPVLGMVDLLILNGLIGMNLVLFTKLYRPAGLLLVPYFLWTFYALCLNGAIWFLNR